MPMFDLSIFTTPEAWISLITLLFLEIVLGVDNLVFIAITTDRLPAEKQHLGRKIGLLGALFMRILFLCFASFLVHMTTPVFTIPFIEIHGEPMGFSVRDLVLLAGGIYLIYKGIDEIRSVLNLTEEKEQHEPEVHRSAITLPQAVITIMIMDLVFSIDSVITAVGLAQHLIIMILAVIIAVVLMMVFIDAISNFINQHTEIKNPRARVHRDDRYPAHARRPGYQFRDRDPRHASRKAHGVLRHGILDHSRAHSDEVQEELSDVGRAQESRDPFNGRSALSGLCGCSELFEVANAIIGNDIARRPRQATHRKRRVKARRFAIVFHVHLRCCFDRDLAPAIHL